MATVEEPRYRTMPVRRFPPECWPDLTSSDIIASQGASIREALFCPTACALVLESSPNVTTRRHVMLVMGNAGRLMLRSSCL
ncbi:hypothetical protein DOTSEDRAFT_85597 [Dothistroma septosporum NZE10]|uniref:Uncharacterized protein n=1 Tax=Dothistroma septosporum (strain NZE10 / CBS 128990) TaxID=675120 RepID=N1PUC3_DOTSN|nr:hypothetical protein DOTSEDRAFT_85597 [Dothistroma septosporum NZE10]